jgi:chaperonin GroES
MQIRPLYDRIVVKRLEREAQTKGGIFIPDTAQEKPMEGRVVAVGRGKLLDNGRLIEPRVKKGDRVLFGKYSGSEVELGGDEHVIVREEDILAVIEPG